MTKLAAPQYNYNGRDYRFGVHGKPFVLINGAWVLTNVPANEIRNGHRYDRPLDISDLMIDYESSAPTDLHNTENL